MTVREILKMGDPRLLRIAQPVREFDTPELRALVDDMFDTMHAANGAGLAAPQIGVDLQLVIFGFAHNLRYPDAPEVPRTVLINPLIVPLSDERLLAGFEARYVGSRRGEYASVDAYTLATLTLTWRPRATAWELQGGIRNLFDEHYADPAGPSYLQNAIEQDGRTILLRATYGF